MRTLIDLLNHGTLPFIGRMREMQQAVDFWRGTFDAQEMRAALLIGEAGVGKSRLIEELIPRIHAESGAVVHLKIYPESATSLVWLIARALGSSQEGERILRVEPEAAPGPVIAALRRLSRLRPTLLIIEDVHLLRGESLREFSLLLNALADDTLSVLCAARPVEMEARSVVERYLVEEIRLDGLDPEELRLLWTLLFETIPERGLLLPLGQATAGNPLAIRSALRGALRSEAIRFDEKKQAWRTDLSDSALIRHLRRNVDLLAEGMAAQLTDQEREAAEQLACLGEIFARETAAELIGTPDRTIEALIFRGIIATSTTPASPLPGRTSDHPLLAFTHTLLHTHLLGFARVEVNRLTWMIASDLPLYSLLPFRLLTDNIEHSTIGGPKLRRAIERSLQTAHTLDISADWGLAPDAWRAAESLFGSAGAAWSDEEQIDLSVQLLVRRIFHLRRDVGSGEYGELVARLLALTDGPLPEGMIHHRLSALRYLHWHEFNRDPAGCGPVWERVELLVNDHPDLRLRPEYIGYLSNVAHTARSVSDTAMLRRVEERYAALLRDDEADETVRSLIRESVSPHLLSLFDTPEELESRLRMLAELSSAQNGADVTVRMLKIALLESIGRIDEAVKEAEETRLQARDLGLSRNALHCSLIRLCGQAPFGGELERIASEARTLCDGATAPFRRNVGIHLTEVGLLRGETEWTRGIVDEFLGDESRLWPESRVLMALAEERLPTILEELPEEDELGRELKEIARVAVDASPESFASATETVVRLLKRPILRKDDLVLLHAVVTLAGTIESNNDTASIDTTEIGHAIGRALTWLEERELHAYMRPIVERYGGRLSKKAATTWRSRISALEKQRNERTSGTAPGRRLRISMLGTITVEQPDGEIRGIGSRLRTLLGLMTADAMLEQPLAHREFISLAAGEDADPEHARKTMNTGVLRLREVMGADGILTDRETPRLNLDLFEVDLLEAHDALNEARDALRDGTLLRAYPALLKGLDRTRGEVPFPTLYEEFFEAAREDFEVRLRSTTIDVTRALLHENDPTSAGELLRRAFDAMPDDEEIAEMLQSALTAVGRRVEAERVRIKSKEAAESW